MTDVTEIVRLDATRVDLVKNPANGFPFLLMKAIEEDQMEKNDTTKTEASAPEGGTTGTPNTVPDIETIVKKAIAEASKASEDRIVALETELAKVKATAIPGGPAMTVPAAMRNQADKASKLTEAAHFQKLADEVNDQDLKRYYKERAVAAKAAV